MNKPLALILMIAVSIPLVGCFDEPTGPDTVFDTSESPRTGSRQKSRYGHQGTHSPNNRNSGRNNRPPSDPDGIVKPRDLDPEMNGDDVATNNDPTGESTEPPVEDKKDPPTTASGDAPYAEAVPGEYGLVYSPFVKDKKALVNVTDDNNVPFPPGTEVVDPHTGKTFRVP